MNGSSNRYYGGALLFSSENGRSFDPKRLAKMMNIFNRERNGFLVPNRPSKKNEDVIVPFLASSNAGGIITTTLSEKELRKRIEEEFEDCQLLDLVSLKLSSANDETLDGVLKLDAIRDGNTRIESADLKMLGGSGSMSVEEAFDGLVGLEQQRELLEKIALLMSRYGRHAITSYHMVFKGNPGTGKTELAQRLNGLLSSLGLSNGVFVDVVGSEMQAQYVGQTAPLVHAKMEQARGGMLFIDEAYTLGSGGYGREAVDALTGKLDEMADELICIIAGYESRLEEELFGQNAGLRDRLGFEIPFPDYTDEELVEIVEILAKRRGLTLLLDARLEEWLILKFRESRRQDRGFANARTARRLVDAAVLESAASRGDRSLCQCDFEQAWKTRLAMGMGKGRAPIGFSC